MWKWLILIVLIFLGLWIALPYFESEEDQVRRHHAKLIGAIRQGDEPTLRTLLASDYKDDWASSKEEAIEMAKEYSRYFRAYQLELTDIIFSPTSTNLEKVLEQGAQLVPKPNVSLPAYELPPTPWTFVWRKSMSQRAKWELIRVTNSDFRP